MVFEHDNHMTSREDTMTVAELTLKIERIYDVARRLSGLSLVMEDIIPDCELLGLDQKICDDFKNHVVAELDVAEKKLDQARDERNKLWKKL